MDPPRLALDMAGVSFCDSTGLRVIITAWQLAQQRKGECVLLQPREYLVQRLKTTGLDRLIKTRESLA